MTEPNPAPPVSSATDEPVSDRYRSVAPADPAEIRRKLLFGAALVFALASMYAGLLQWGRVVQFGLAGVAVVVVLMALVSGASGPPGSTGSAAPPQGPDRPAEPGA